MLLLRWKTICLSGCDTAGVCGRAVSVWRAEPDAHHVTLWAALTLPRKAASGHQGAAPRQGALPAPHRQARQSYQSPTQPALTAVSKGLPHLTACRILPCQLNKINSPLTTFPEFYSSI